MVCKNPEWFDGLSLTTCSGDIITDLGAMIQGGMGIAAGGNINQRAFQCLNRLEALRQKYKGKNVINPLAAICAAGMMLEHLGEEKAGKTIEKAVMKVTGKHLKSLAAGHMGHSTTEVGNMVTRYVKEA